MSEMRWLSIHVPMPATGSECGEFWRAVWGWEGSLHLKIERAKILWMFIEHHDVPVMTSCRLGPETPS